MADLENEDIEINEEYDEDIELRQKNHDLFWGTGGYGPVPNAYDDEDAMWKEALEFAKIKHEGQKRDEGVPYFEHIKGVLDILIKETDATYDKILTVAVLHDVLEDTDCTYEELEDEFGEEVAGAVLLLTRKKDPVTGEKEPYEEYTKRIFENEEFMYVRSIKAADRLHNLRSIPNANNPEKMYKYIIETEKCILPYENVTDRELMRLIKVEVESLKGRKEMQGFFHDEPEK